MPDKKALDADIEHLRLEPDVWTRCDELVAKLAATQPRLRDFLVGLLGYASEGPEPPQLEQYIAEKLPQLLSRTPLFDARQTALRHRLAALTGIFWRQLEDDALAIRLGKRQAPRTAKEWEPILARAVEDLGSLRYRRLSPARLKKVLEDGRGGLRKPKAMAMHLLYEACARGGEKKPQTLDSFRRGFAPDRDRPTPLGAQPARP